MADLSKFKWTTKDGRELFLKDMTVAHLRNARRWCKQRAETYADGIILEAYSFQSTLLGEMACDAMDSEINRLEYQAELYAECAEIFRLELANRGEKV